MRIEKEYLYLEDVYEIRIYNATGKDFYNPTPQEFDIEDHPLQEFINNISDEVHILIPYDDGNDFIVQRISNFLLFLCLLNLPYLQPPIYFKYQLPLLIYKTFD